MAGIRRTSHAPARGVKTEATDQTVNRSRPERGNVLLHHSGRGRPDEDVEDSGDHQQVGRLPDDRNPAGEVNGREREPERAERGDLGRARHAGVAQEPQRETREGREAPRELRTVEG